MTKSKNIKIVPILSSYADCAFWGVGVAKGEGIFIGLSTHNPRKSAEIFRYDTNKSSIDKVANIGEIIIPKEGELPQGKIHTPLFSGSDGWLYFATHFAYPYGKPQTVNYAGGHWMRLNPRTEECQDLGIGVKNEGIVTAAMDTQRMILYGLSAPSFSFLVFDVQSRKTRNFGKIADGSICRTMTIDSSGNVYGSFENNKIFKYDLIKDKINVLSVCLPDSLIKTSEWNGVNKKGVNHTSRAIWRTAVYDAEHSKIYGVHARDSSLFSFYIKTMNCLAIVPLCSDRFFDHPGDIYPTLSLLNKDSTLYYAPAEGLFDYKISEKMSGFTHLISFNTSLSKKIDLGEIIDTDNGRRVFGVGGGAVDKNGDLFYVGAVETFPNERYHKYNLIGGKPYHLGLIHIRTT